MHLKVLCISFMSLPPYTEPNSQLELKGINNPAMEILTSKTEISLTVKNIK